MTKTVIIGALVLIGLSSCKRDYLCSCTYEGKAASNTEIYNSSKADARNECAMKESAPMGQEWECTVY